MGAKLTIKSFYDAAWRMYGPQYREAITERNDLLAQVEAVFDPEVVQELQSEIDVALGRIENDELPDPKIITMPEYRELLVAETAIEGIVSRIEDSAIFVDQDGGILQTLGLSWRQDILPLVHDQKSPGYIEGENVKRFLSLVENAKEPLLFEDENDGRQRTLIRFLQRAVEARKAIWCDL